MFRFLGLLLVLSWLFGTTMLGAFVGLVWLFVGSLVLVGFWLWAQDAKLEAARAADAQRQREAFIAVSQQLSPQPEAQKPLTESLRGIL